MSTFPQHVDNISKLKEMGFNVDDSYEDGEVSMDSWGYDELVYTMSDIVTKLSEDGCNKPQHQQVSEKAIAWLHDNHPEVYNGFYDQLGD